MMFVIIYYIKARTYMIAKIIMSSNMIKKVVIPIIIKGMTDTSDGRSYSEIGEKNWLENNKDYGEEIHLV